jgi:hypothetical protein
LWVRTAGAPSGTKDEHGTRDDHRATDLDEWGAAYGRPIHRGDPDDGARLQFQPG